MLHGRPILGRAIVVQGIEVKCPETGALLDYYVDLDNDQALEGLCWLTAKEVIRERDAYRTNAMAVADSFSGHSITIVKGRLTQPEVKMIQSFGL